MYNHWSFHSVGQVGTRVLRWNGITEDFQEECYNVPDIVQDEFQAVQGQIAWVARRGQDTSDHLAFIEHELKLLWIQVRLEQKLQVPVDLGAVKTRIPVWMRAANDSVHCQEHIPLLFV